MFDPDRLYRPDDSALRMIAARQTMAQWRAAGQGPPYLKLGARVGYRGSDLNAWVERQLVRPRAEAEAAGAA